MGSSEEGFEDFDGWSESDTYAVGGYGDVWHFDGKGRRQIPFPTDKPLKSVCCGGDGQVYISGYEGVTFAVKVSVALLPDSSSSWSAPTAWFRASGSSSRSARV